LLRLLDGEGAYSVGAGNRQTPMLPAVAFYFLQLRPLARASLPDQPCTFDTRTLENGQHATCDSFHHAVLHQKGQKYPFLCTGEITQAEIGGNCPSKDITRMRRDGFLYPLGHPKGERWEVNGLTGCRFKIYSWTGKIPANWVKTGSYTGRERRKVKRGGC